MVGHTALSLFVLVWLTHLAPGAERASGARPLAEQPPAGAVGDGAFTATVSNWPAAGARTEVSGRAFAVLRTPQGYDHIVLCDENPAPGSRSPGPAWILGVVGTFARDGQAAVREHPISNTANPPSFAEVRATLPVAKPKPVRPQRVTLNEGMLTITAVSDGIWAGSATARQGDAQLEATFRARAVPAVPGTGIMLPTRVCER